MRSGYRLPQPLDRQREYAANPLLLKQLFRRERFPFFRSHLRLGRIEVEPGLSSAAFEPALRSGLADRVPLEEQAHEGPEAGFGWIVGGQRAVLEDAGEEVLGSGSIGALIIGGVDPLDSNKSADALEALDKAFVVSLEIAPSEVSARANVVLPVAAITEKSGSFLNWEGRARSFDAAVDGSLNRSDLRILSMITAEMGAELNLGTVTAAAKEIASLGAWDGARVSMKPVNPTAAPALSGNQFILNSWRRLLDLGTLQKGEENLAGTARQTVAVISPNRAQAMDVADGDLLKISTSHGSVTLAALVEEIHDDAIWAPRNSRGSQLLVNLGAGHGAVVTVVKL